MIAVEGRGAEPAGTYRPTAPIGRIRRSQRTPGAVSTRQRRRQLRARGSASRSRSPRSIAAAAVAVRVRRARRRTRPRVTCSACEARAVEARA